ncbi:MAG: hypothetical protein BalsKO_17280 [Balneolaceae bacterium]
MTISELFDIKVAKSKGTEDYDSGQVPFVTNTTLNNGVVKYVDPYEDDKLFDANTICISGLGYATLQLNQYLPKGNGGDSATILEPIEEMSIEVLVYYTAVFNLLHRWRFSFGRKASKKRIQDLEIPEFDLYNGQFNENFEQFVNVFKSNIEAKEELI